MIFGILADAVVIAHFLWILFLIFGAAVGRRYRTIRIFHISGLVFAGTLQVFDWFCPLTHLEVWLRQQHDPGQAYSGSYIVHYLEKVIYINVDKTVIVVLTILLCGINAVIYTTHRNCRRKTN